VGGRLRSAIGIGLSALVLAGVIVVAAAYGLGVRTSYESGIDSRLGSQIERDFLADQDSEAAALSTGDSGPLGSRLTDSALSDVIQQISNNSASGTTPSVSYKAASITISRAQDPADPSLVIEVQEDGSKTVTTSSSPDSAPSQQTISFHGDFWLRNLSGHYVIADQNFQLQPTSPVANLGLIAAALAAVGIAAALVVRRRGVDGVVPVRAPAADRLPMFEPMGIEMEPAPEPALPPAEVVIRTFGGLQVHRDGKDWAAALSGRPITGFVWLRLLVAAIRDPHARPSREEIARQASPGLDRETQLRRLRNFIYQGLRDLPDALKNRLVVEPQVLGFKLKGADVDAVNLLAVSAECARRSTLTNVQMARAKSVLEASSGVFLPEFESIEDIATDHHPTCSELIRDLRNMLAGKRVDLAIALASSHLARNHPDPAISLLEGAYAERPESADLATSLASAYRRAGRETEAKGLESRLALGPA
jgi:DNA-binding SARP family transcriptional activator